MNIKTFQDRKELYEKQLEQIANLVILKDKPLCEFAYQPYSTPQDRLAFLRWIGRGEVVAGSYMCRVFNSAINYSDVDIYFHSKKDAEDYALLNNRKISSWVQDVCAYTTNNENLIYGVPYSTPEELISGFDIRACAIAFDPSSNQIISIDGAIRDVLDKRLTFQVGARSYSLNRLLKYITSKNFTIDSWQRAIFIELIKVSNASKDIELIGTYQK